MHGLKAEERRAWRVWLLLSGGRALLFSLAFAAAMIYRITEVGLSPLELVLVGTALELSTFVFELPTGVVADVYSRRVSILIGLVLIGLAFLLEGLVPQFTAVLLAQVLWGLGYTFTSGAAEAWITDEIGEEAAAQAFVRGAQLGTVAGMAGIVCGVALASLRLNLPIVLAGALLMALAAMLALVMPERGFTRCVGDESRRRAMVATLRAGMAQLRLRPVLRLVLLVELISGLYSEGFDRLWQKHILENLALPTLRDIPLQPVVWFGLFELVSGLCAIGLTELLRRRVTLTRHRPTVRALLLVNLVIVAGMLVFSLAEGLAVALLALWCVAAARAAGGPVSAAWLNQSAAPQIRATMFSLRGQVNAVGQIAGGPPAGLIGQRSLRAALLAGGLVQASALPLLGLELRRKPAEADVESQAGA